ncbi:PspA/IM30 family protein [Paucisalibacillus sp. EB02]|uniref:PspA/IM30 family protein n=1 Tax=Paucisalibacillus sp. EB02 TaxID=1347087 RepID=UPI0004B9CF52|nr:PspA/IM30 family protein [Paucisalibacillus sp. EB02]
MSMLKRVRDILASNINAKIESTKNPEMEISNYIREMERDYREFRGEVEASTSLMNRAKRNLHECESEIKKMERYAVKALENDDEDKARQFLEEKASLKPKQQEYEKQYQLATIKVEQMSLAVDKLTQDLAVLSNQRDIIFGKLATAKSKQQANEIGLSQSNVRLTTFDQLEEKANRALAEAEALEQLRKGLDYDIDKLGSQYDKSLDVDAEIVELKDKLK